MSTVSKAQKELDEYKGKVASLKEVIEEHGLDANSLFAQAGIETDGNGKDSGPRQRLLYTDDRME